jgi:hypothetical protein
MAVLCVSPGCIRSESHPLFYWPECTFAAFTRGPHTTCTTSTTTSTSRFSWSALSTLTAQFKPAPRAGKREIRALWSGGRSLCGFHHTAYRTARQSSPQPARLVLAAGLARPGGECGTVPVGVGSPGCCSAHCPAECEAWPGVRQMRTPFFSGQTRPRTTGMAPPARNQGGCGWVALCATGFLGKFRL